MRAALLDDQGVVTNVVMVALREVPAGAKLIPDGLGVAVGWTYSGGRFAPPTEAPAPPPRNLDAEYAKRIDEVSTMAGLRQVMRDYFTERAGQRVTEN